MATISQRIELQGGDTAKQQLADLAAAGKAAFGAIQDAAQKGGDFSRNFDTTKARAQINDLVTGAKTLGSTFQQLGQSAQRASAGVAAVGDSAADGAKKADAASSHWSTLTKVLLGASAGAVGLGAAMFAAAKKAADGAKTIGDAAEDSGTSFGAFQKARFILEQMGLSSDDAKDAISKLTENIKNGTNTAIDRLTQLGVHFANTAEGAKSAQQILAQFGGASAAINPLIDKLKALGVVVAPGADQLQRAAALAKQFGIDGSGAFAKIKAAEPDAAAAISEIAGVIAKLPASLQKQAAINAFGDELGPKLLEKLKEGQAGIKEFTDDFAKLHLGISEDSVDMAKEFATAMQRFNDVTLQSRIEFGSHFLPIVTEGIKQFTNLLRLNRQPIQDWAQGIVSSLKGLVADVFALFNGRDDEVKTGWLVTIKNLITQGVIPAFKGLVSAVQPVIDKINQFFGSSLTAGGAAIVAAITFLIGGFNALLLAITALFAGSSPLIDKFKASLASVGINVEQIKKFFVDLFNEIKQAIVGIDFKSIFSNVDAKTVATTVLEVVGAFVLLRKAAILAAPLISKVVGHEVSGDALLLVGALGQLTGVTQTLGTLLFAAASATTILINGLRFLGFILEPIAAAVAFFLGIPVELVGLVGIAIVGIIAAVVIYWSEIKNAFVEGWQFVEDKTTEAWDFIANTVSTAWNTIKGFFSADTLAAVWDGIKTGASAAWDDIVAVAAQAWDAIVNSATSIPDRILGILSGLADAIITPFSIAGDAIAAIWDAIIAKIQTAKQLIGMGGTSDTSGFDGSGASGSFASGGLVRGPGTGTSDSILARLSNFEHVQPAHVVKQPGVLAFLEELRRTGDLARTIQRYMRGFSMGGLVESVNRSLAVPGFAAGGLVNVPALASASRGRPLTLILDGKTFGGLSAPDDVADRLTRFARSRAMASAGRAPSRVR